MEKDNYDVAELLHVMVNASKNYVSEKYNVQQGKEMSGVLVNLDSNSFYLDKIVGFKEKALLPKFGAFGPRNRGKSSMLNALLGEAILPVSPIPLTRTAVEIKRDPNVKDWEVTVFHSDGRIDPTERPVSQIGVENIIARHGTSESKGPVAETIQVLSAFPGCKILEKGGILVDTPGAEPAFGKDPEEAANNVDKDEAIDETLTEDTERALEILSKVHVVIFCARGDIIGNPKDRDFYRKQLSGLRPLIVVNMNDKPWSNKDMDRKECAIKNYDLPSDRTFLLSAKWAREGKNEDDQRKRTDSGIDIFESKILSEIDDLKPDNGVKTCFEEYDRNLQNYWRKKNDDRIIPPKVHVMKFYQALEKLNEDWTNSILEVLRNSTIWKNKIK